LLELARSIRVPLTCTSFFSFKGYDTSFGYFHHDNDYWTEHVGPWVDLYNETETTTWAGPGPAYAPTNGAGYGYNSTVAECAAAYSGKSCGMTGPEDIYEEFKFKTRVLEIINDHDASNAEKPLFLCCELATILHT
jgi:hypothetical protein